MSEEERMELDNDYAKDYSFGRDIKLILKTIPALFQKENVQNKNSMEDFPQIERFGGFFLFLESSLYMILIRVGYEYNNAFQRIDYKF